MSSPEQLVQLAFAGVLVCAAILLLGCCFWVVYAAITDRMNKMAAWEDAESDDPPIEGGGHRGPQP